MATFPYIVAFALFAHIIWSSPHDHIHHQHHQRGLTQSDTSADIEARDEAGSPGVTNLVVYLNDQGEPTATSTVYASQPQATQNNRRDLQADQPITGQSGSALHGGSKDKGFAHGVTYSPYNADHSCKSEGQVAKDLADLSNFSLVRLYGTDCNQIANVIQAVGSKASIFAGIFKIDDIPGEVDSLAAQVQGHWTSIAAVSVGNEQVNSGAASVDKVVAAIGQARSALKGKGYSGDVVTVDTMIAMQAHPQLCLVSDFCAINCHAFFDGNVLPADAGKFVADWARKISSEVGGKRVVVTESGWPSQGTANKLAVPGPSQQQQAVQSLKQSFHKDLILYTLYNDLWKGDRPDTHGAEKWWGLRGSAK